MTETLVINSFLHAWGEQEWRGAQAEMRGFYFNDLIHWSFKFLPLKEDETDTYIQFPLNLLSYCHSQGKLVRKSMPFCCPNSIYTQFIPDIYSMASQLAGLTYVKTLGNFLVLGLILYICAHFKVVLIYILIINPIIHKLVHIFLIGLIWVGKIIKFTELLQCFGHICNNNCLLNCKSCQQSSHINRLYIAIKVLKLVIFCQ